MKYQYVIIQGNTDYYDMLTSSTVARNDAIVVNGIIDVNSKRIQKIVYKIYEYLEGRRKYSIVKCLLPFMFHRKVQTDKPICFVIWSWYANDVKAFYGDYLRAKYPGCKIVCRFEDIIEKMPYKNIEYYRDAFDLLQSFDEGDAAKYNISYYPSWYDSVDVQNDSDILESDVLFVGRAKDRFEFLLKTYDWLEVLGVTCRFYLVDVPEEERVERKNIIYSDYIPYYRVLQMVKKSRCLLEVLQEFGTSETLRVYEAITYNKKLITNNLLLKERKYYSEEAICCYQSLEEITADFICSEHGSLYLPEYIEKLRPIKMLEAIDCILLSEGKGHGSHKC